MPNKIILMVVLLQTKPIRIMYGAKRLDHISTCFQQLCVLKFIDIVELQTALFYVQRLL